MLMSPTIGALAAALAKAQGVFDPAVKDAANPFFKSKYCDLSGAIKATRDALASNGLAVVQVPRIGENGAMQLESILLHSSGEFIGGLYPIQPVKNDPQGLGSAMTYGRRYSFMALVGLAPEDDDGEAAHGRGERDVPKSTVRRAAGMPERDEEGIAQDVEEIFGPDEPGAESEPLINEGQMRLLKASVKRFKIPLKRAKELVMGIAGTEDLDAIPSSKVEEILTAFTAEGNKEPEKGEGEA